MGYREQKRERQDENLQGITLKNIYWIKTSNIFRKGYLEQSIIRYVDGNAIMMINYFECPLNINKKVNKNS